MSKQHLQFIQIAAEYAQCSVALILHLMCLQESSGSLHRAALSKMAATGHMEAVQPIRINMCCECTRHTRFQRCTSIKGSKLFH